MDTITSSSNNLVSVLEEYDLKGINGGATLEVTTVYNNVEADRMREFFKNNGNSFISKEYESYYAEQHPRIKIVGHPTIKDDKTRNKFTVRESYTIDSIWQPMMEKPGYISIDFLPSTIAEVLYLSNTENRVNPISLPYPVAREHKTLIHLPEQWSVETESDVVSNDIFYYDFEVDYDKVKNVVKIKNYLKIQKSTIEQNELKTYQKAITDLEKSYGYSIFIPENGTGIQSENIAFGLGKLVFYFITVGGIIFLIVYFSKRKKKDTRNQFKDSEF